MGTNADLSKYFNSAGNDYHSGSDLSVGYKAEHYSDDSAAEDKYLVVVVNNTGGVFIRTIAGLY